MKTQRSLLFTLVLAGHYHISAGDLRVFRKESVFDPAEDDKSGYLPRIPGQDLLPFPTPDPAEVKDHNKETPIKLPGIPLIWEEETQMPVSAESAFALAYITMIAMVPIILGKSASEGGKVTKTQLVQAVALFIWLLGGIFLFTNILKFQSSHFRTNRSLTVVETIYLMSQILTTVGYGDITPAYPRGRVFIGIYVTLAILMVADMVSNVTSIVIEKGQAIAKQIAHQTAEKTMKLTVALEKFPREADRRASEVTRFEDEKHAELRKKVDMPWGPLISWFLAYLVLVVAGVLFYHLYPGENKTFFEAIYMSIITLSTVGFGAFTADTEGGKVFGAFWMLFGVVALGGVVSSFTTLMVALKELELQNKNPQAAKEQFLKIAFDVKLLGKDENVNLQSVDKYSFLKFGLLQSELVPSEVIESIEHSFYALRPQSDKGVKKVSFADMEGLWAKVEATTPRGGEVGTKASS